MCGIAGLFKLTGRPTAEDAVAVVRMMEAEIHRGPDDWELLIPESIGGDPRVQAVVGAGGGEHVGVYPGPAAAPGAVLATRRLSILDLLPRGHMPMGSRDGRLWITYNGEAYKLLRPRAVEAVGDAFRARRLHWSRPWALVVLAQLDAARAARIHPPAPCRR